ncbi:hypothetical protein L228DRAFT_181779 [Xylona heveae TC161]|uniref:Uncharacterized protein n=1 Tax=Xylona heveae (strain CBS 132557 / TC161) TaxID=1328760 RepID=A0A165FFB0_XYLHT|nr:hypothetical protein L228DRAFT_181779 [Xylona heveae TC161]KZF20908.1 hypothetical protein L228DRAFT_181779 [Xylona heveae TC161]
MADEEEDERYTPSVYEAQTHLQHTSGNTLLPGPIASLVSLAARSSSLYLRLGIFVGGLALDGARATTLTGLELSRAVIEAVLSRAAHDISDRNHGPDGQAQVENLLERSRSIQQSTRHHLWRLRDFISL